jgi:hypothetical protein
MRGLPVRRLPAGRLEPDLLGRPGDVPKVMDTFTPAGVDQKTELDPTRGRVVLQGVTVP